MARLRVGHQHSQIWPILARFVDYYSLFWGLREVSTINEPWGAFTIRSSTLAVLTDSDPFHGLLLTVLGPQTRFIVVEPQGALTCRSSTLAVFVHADLFHGLLLSFGVPKRFPWLSNPGVRLLVNSGLFPGLLLTVFRSRSDFHD